MGEYTSIQWADTTVNPIMGCGGCELFPPPGDVLGAIDQAVAKVGIQIASRGIYKNLISEAYAKISQPLSGHKNAVNTTNIWHLKELFLAQVKRDHGKGAQEAAEGALRHAITCYAAVQHLNKGQNILKPIYEGKSGYAPVFESVTKFKGRTHEKTDNLKDLLGCSNPQTPWKGCLPRMIFVSDMGDALSTQGDFNFLKSDLLPCITSKNGQRHLWLWLTKRPAYLAKFADQIGGLPPNICAMTTLTGPDEESLKRLELLKQVKAHIRGLSIEPLWQRIPPSKLNLKGIDWVIVGGESGAGKQFTRPFALEWAEELRQHCHQKGVAFFLKQLGRNPSHSGQIIRLKDKHGGDWEEWPDEVLKMREFPQAFHNYRKSEMKQSPTPRPVVKKSIKTSTLEVIQEKVTQKQKSDFKRLDDVVKKGIENFAKAGEALSKIHEGKLWRAGGFATWDEYCRSVAGMSRVHAYRLIKASECMVELKAMPEVTTYPVSEFQVRPLLRLQDLEEKKSAWITAVSVASISKESDTQPTAKDVHGAVASILRNGMHFEKDVDPTPPTRSQQRSKIVEKLQTIVRKRKSWDDVENLLRELEKLM